MFISKIKLSGFKSFSEETNLSFDYGLNGIIGPNGSGKSNIVEAIKWVMGESSSKNLRGSGMNDVIFSGSTTKASKNIAYVTIIIQVKGNGISSANKKFIKSGNIEVERQIIRDTGSTYRINGSEVRAKDVQFLFADLSSGSRASNIIDQGSVGNLIIQKPSERRKILDEAAGISGISARKTESINKLEATKRNLARLADILMDNKERIVKLKKQAESARKFKETKEKIEELNKTISFAKLQKAIINQKNLKLALETNSTEYSDKLEKLEFLGKERNTLKNNSEKCEKDIININQENLKNSSIIEKTNLEISNDKNQLESFKNLKEQINKNKRFQEEILENSLSRLSFLESTLAKFKNLNENKNFDELKQSFLKVQEKYMKSSQSLDERTLKLRDKKELVNHKEYEKTLLEKKLFDVRSELAIIKNGLSKKQTTFNTDDSALTIERLKINTITKIKELKINLKTHKKKLDEFSSLSIAVKSEKEKLALQINDQKENVNNVKNEISIYSSLGFKDANKSILKQINIAPDYKLAFYLALGDGIEATNDTQSPVIWRSFVMDNVPPLLKEVICANELVKGPKEMHLFLSQVGIVKSIEEGNRYQKLLKPGQILVSQEGALWRWDGLYIKDGTKTITYKRILSTTKLIDLEKSLKDKSSKLNKLEKINSSIKEKLSKIDEEISNIIKEVQTIEGSIMINSDKLIEIETDLLGKKNKKQLALLEINKDKSNILEKSDEEKFLMDEVKVLKNLVVKESGQIVKIKKDFSDIHKENNLVKDKYENIRIQFEINKKQINAEVIQKEKTQEELSTTKKQIKNTKAILKLLEDDIKKVNYDENILLTKPDNSEKIISTIKSKILSNKDTIEKIELSLNTINNNLDLTTQKFQKLNTRLEMIKENKIRKETQMEQLNSFIEYEEEKIGTDLKLEKNIVIDNATKFDYSNIDIKNSETLLRNLKNKVESMDEVNLTAEKELTELENKINSILVEEKDLNSAAKKLEKAIEELNKEARNRVMKTFSNINNTFSDLFKKLFDGGKAYLELVDSDDPLEAGLELLVSPPGKKLQRLSLLSGGEKALASLALIFSTFINKQTPICILDEVDAPLDDFNVERFCNLLKEAAEITNKKFLVVTHNKITMGYMNKIYGVTMNEPGISKIISVNLDKIEPVFAAE